MHRFAIPILLALIALLWSGCLATLPPVPKTLPPVATGPLTPAAAVPSSLPSQAPAAKAGADAAATAATDAKGAGAHLVAATTAMSATAAAIKDAQAAAAGVPAAAAVLPPLTQALSQVDTASIELRGIVPSVTLYQSIAGLALDLSQRLAKLQTVKDQADAALLQDAKAIADRDAALKQDQVALKARDEGIQAREAELADLRTTLALPATAAPGEARHAVKELQATAKDTKAKLTDLQAQWATVTAHLKLSPTASASEITAAFDHERATRQAAESSTFQRILIGASLVLAGCIALIIWVPLVRSTAMGVALIAGAVILGAVAAIHDIVWVDEHPEYVNYAGLALVVGVVGYLLYLAHKHNLTAATLKGVVAGVERAATSEEPALAAAAASVKTEISAQMAPGSATRVEVDKVRHAMAAEAAKGKSLWLTIWHHLTGHQAPAGSPPAAGPATP